MKCDDYDPDEEEEHERGEAMDDRDYSNYFDRVCVVNLDRRPDRWDEFQAGLPADWPFLPPERVPAIDGKRVKPPKFWKPGGGAWGCYRTHVRLIEEALNSGQRRILLLEDDAIFCDDFAAKVREFLDHLPDQWDMLYLGGQHLREKKGKPRRLNEYVYEPFNVNRTHAFAVDVSGGFGQQLYNHLHKWDDWRPSHHIDHHLGRLHETRAHKVFCPREWLVGQRQGKSNINGREFSNDRFWRPAVTSSAGHETHLPVYAVLGTHASGSSALAGVLWHLGVHLGNKLVGYHGKPPINGGEAVQLAKICEEVAKLRDTQRQLPSKRIEDKLRWFVNQKRREAKRKGTVPAIKYPQLCVCGDELRAVLGDRLRVIACDRPLEESIKSIQRRTNSPGDERLAAHQRWLHAERERLIESLPATDVLRVQYAELLGEPADVVQRLAAFMGLRPTAERVEKAVGYVEPEKRHVGVGG